MNICEHVNVFAYRAIMEHFFNENGCKQPHRHAKCMSDGSWLELVLLLMNTRRQDVLEMVNYEIQRLGVTRPISKAQFDKMWARKFSCTYLTILQMPNMLGIPRMHGGSTQLHTERDNMCKIQPPFTIMCNKTTQLLACKRRRYTHVATLP